MGISCQKTSRQKLEAAFRMLASMRASARGPFVTPKRQRIYLVGRCILTEAEFVTLYEISESNPERISKLLVEFNELQTAKLDSWGAS